MKVRMLTAQCGHGDTARTSAGVVVRDAGAIYDVDQAEAKRLLESGQAEPVAEKDSDRAEKRGPGRPRKVVS